MKEILLNTVNTTSDRYKKYTALVDDEDYEIVNRIKWSACRKGALFTFYARGTAIINGIRITMNMHRFILWSGDIENKIIDHIDGNGLNNQRSNLRICTPTQNSINRPACRNSTSKYKGVSWDKTHNKWNLNIYSNNICHVHKRFKTEIEAALAYNEYAKIHHGEFAYFNKVEIK